MEGEQEELNLEGGEDVSTGSGEEDAQGSASEVAIPKSESQTIQEYFDIESGEGEHEAAEEGDEEEESEEDSEGEELLHEEMSGESIQQMSAESSKFMFKKTANDFEEEESMHQVTFDIRADEDDEIFIDGPHKVLSGDFDVVGTFAALDLTTMKVEELQEEEESVIEESETVEEEEEVIDREVYYERYEQVNKLLPAERMKNYYLQRQMTLYCKKKKMDYAFLEANVFVDTIQKYRTTLDKFLKTQQEHEAIVTEIQKELEMLQNKQATLKTEVEQSFRNLQDRERQIGTGLISSKTGKPLLDKHIDTLLKRQEKFVRTIAKIRLIFIKLRNRSSEIQEQLRQLDYIGEGKHLIDFELLKMENRSLADKIEEREEELTRLRYQCQNDIQVLAHIREKSAAVEMDIDQLKDTLADLNYETNEVRSRLNYVKQIRDNYRIKTTKTIKECGLLIEPNLLQDMEDSMKEFQVKSHQLEVLQNESKEIIKKIRIVRKNIELFAESHARKATKPAETQTRKNVRIHKGKEVYDPIIPAGAFDPEQDYKYKTMQYLEKKRKNKEAQAKNKLF